MKEILILLATVATLLVANKIANQCTSAKKQIHCGLGARQSQPDAKLQAEQVATADGNEAAISSGLLHGGMVVSAGVHVLSPGQKVKI